MLEATTYILNTIFFFIMFSLCLLVARSVIMSRNSDNNDSKKLWEREAEANSVRKQDISKLNYILLPIDKLPMQSLLDIGEHKLYDELSAFASIKALNLSAYTNTELKLLYGPANLEELSRYDDNFTSLIRLLHKAGTLLSNANDSIDVNDTCSIPQPNGALPESSQINAAIAFLEYAVSIGSDISGTYELLGTLYKQTENNYAFDKLIISASKVTSLSKDVTLSKLNNIKINSK